MTSSIKQLAGMGVTMNIFILQWKNIVCLIQDSEQIVLWKYDLNLIFYKGKLKDWMSSFKVIS